MPKYSKESIVFNKIMGDKIRKLRTAINLTCQEVALELNIGRCQYTNIENGLSGTIPEKLLIMARVFNCTIGDIFPTEREIKAYTPTTKKEKRRRVLEHKIAYYTKQLAEL